MQEKSEFEEIKLKQVNIEGLHGYYNISIPLDKKANLFVGENGLGKTTILNIIYFLLKKEYLKLANYDFKKITIKTSSDKKICLKYKNLELLQHLQYLQHFDEKSNFKKKELFKIQRNIERKLYRELNKEQKLYLFDEINDTKHINHELFFNEKIDSQNMKNYIYELIEFDRNLSGLSTNKNLLYLPTYRRIENEFKEFDSEKIEDSGVLIRFGMSDVQKAIDTILDNIRQEAMRDFSEMTGVLLKQYINADNLVISKEALDSEVVEIILERVGTQIDTSDKKEILRLIQNKSFYNEPRYNYLRNLLNKLIENYENQKVYDDKIKQFTKTCNNYFTDKYFYYDESTLTVDIFLKRDFQEKKISLEELSSGEKQIVSIFSQLYLQLEEKTIIIIDEPELSLSILWQRKLLPDIIKSDKCEKLIAVTHSPFIFDNELEDEVSEIEKVVKVVSDFYE
ncbi:TPA: AAA family ATPase [Enterococcus faecalis]|nr:AAA family ATPase [Enterococcus faecalis]HBC1835944.1 AAA family ATPase [Enterococcus faecalis]